MRGSRNGTAARVRSRLSFRVDHEKLSPDRCHNFRDDVSTIHAATASPGPSGTFAPNTGRVKIVLKVSAVATAGKRTKIKSALSSRSIYGLNALYVQFGRQGTASGEATVGEMKCRLIPATFSVVFSLTGILVLFGCGTSSPAVSPTAAAFESSAVTKPLALEGGSLAYPLAGGYSATFQYSSNNAAPETRVALVTTTKPVANVPGGVAPPGKFLVMNNRLRSGAFCRGKTRPKIGRSRLRTCQKAVRPNIGPWALRLRSQPHMQSLARFCAARSLGGGIWARCLRRVR